MNIRPIDLQVMIPKTTEVSRIAQAQDQQGALQQQQKTENWQHTLVQRRQQVQTTPAGNRSNRVDTENLDEDEKKKGTKQDEQSGKESGGDETKESSATPAKDPKLGGRIDIKT